MERKAVSIRRGYITLFVTVLLVTVLLSASLSCYVLASKSYSRVKRDDVWLVSQLVESAEYLMQSAENVSASLAFDNELQSALISYEYGNERPSLEDVRLRINDTLSSKVRFNAVVYECLNVVLFSNDGSAVGSKERYDMSSVLQDYPWHALVEDSDGRPVWLPMGYDERSPETRAALSIPIVRRIFSVQSGQGNTLEEYLTVGKPLGYVLAYFDSSMFAGIVSEYSRTAKRFYIVDQSGLVISSGSPEDIGTRLEIEEGDRYSVLDGEEVLLTSMPVGDTGWSYLCLTYRSEVERDSALTLLFCLFLAALLLAAFIVLGLALSRMTAKPIYTLVDAFKRSGKERVVLEERTVVREFNELYDSFNQTMETIHELDERVYRSRLEKQELTISIKESQIQALRQQINPHFLYNTLDSINWQALMNGDREVSGMICTLGQFFRSNTRADENEIPLSEELKGAELYVRLSKIRFGERLRYVVAEEGDPGSVPVLRLLLQPLIENSIKHGLEETGKDETVTVTASLGHGTLTLSVKDDGPGMDEERLKGLRQLWEAAGTDDPGPSRSVGLSNVFRRLALTYYGRCQVVILSRLGEGTEIIIRIRLKESGEN